MLDTPSSLGGRTTISHDPIVRSTIDHQRSSDRRLRQPRSGGRNGPDSHNAWTKDWGQVRLPRILSSLGPIPVEDSHYLWTSFRGAGHAGHRTNSIFCKY